MAYEYHTTSDIGGGGGWRGVGNDLLFEQFMGGGSCVRGGWGVGGLGGTSLGGGSEVSLAGLDGAEGKVEQ